MAQEKLKKNDIVLIIDKTNQSGKKRKQYNSVLDTIDDVIDGKIKFKNNSDIDFGDDGNHPVLENVKVRKVKEKMFSDLFKFHHGNIKQITLIKIDDSLLNTIEKDNEI